MFNFNCGSNFTCLIVKDKEESVRTNLTFQSSQDINNLKYSMGSSHKRYTECFLNRVQETGLCPYSLGSRIPSSCRPGLSLCRSEDQKQSRPDTHTRGASSVCTPPPPRRHSSRTPGGPFYETSPRTLASPKRVGRVHPPWCFCRYSSLVLCM